MRSPLALIPALLILFFVSCTRDTAVLCLDPMLAQALPPFSESDGSGLNFDETARTLDWRLDIVRPTGFESASRELETFLRARRGVLCVFMNPLLGPEADRLAASFPDLRFFLFGPSAATLPTVADMTPDRIAAFTELGDSAARFVQAQGLAEYPAPLVGFVHTTQTEERRLEAEAFRTAYRSLLPDELGLTVQIIDTLDQENALRERLETWQTAGVRVFLLFLSSLNDTALAYLQTYDVRVVTENWSSTGAFGSHVFASVEYDYLAAFRTALIRASSDFVPGGMTLNGVLRPARFDFYPAGWPGVQPAMDASTATSGGEVSAAGALPSAMEPASTEQGPTAP